MLLTIGLGTNLGNKLLNLKKAIYHLKTSGIFSDNTEIKSSKIYQTAALLKKNSPKKWALDFLNMNIFGESNMPAELILKKTQYIENILGRKQNDDVWAPRIIDIDILLYGNLIMHSDKLTIPHTELYNRAWCIKPISDFSEDIIDPISNESFSKIYKEKFHNYKLKEYIGNIYD